MRRLYRQIRDALEARLPTTREMRWRARILVAFFALQIACNLFLLPAVFLGAIPEVLWIVVFSEVLYGGLFVLAWWGRAWRLSSMLTVLVVMGIVTYGALLKPEIQPSSIAALMMFIVLATMLVGRWGAIWTSVVSSTTLLLDSGLLTSTAMQQDGDAVSDVSVSVLMPLLTGALMVVMEYVQQSSFRELEQARQQAEAGARAKDTFLATMSHEIRTPLNGVLGLAQVLQHTALDGEQQELVGTLRSSGEALQRVLDDVLDYSRLEAGELTLESLTFSPATLLQEAVALFAAPAGARGLALRHTVDAGVPPLLVGDAFRLRQILLNLIGNAVKFTENGEITVAARYSEGWLALSVQDSGIGIDPARLPLLFRPFSQADASTTRRFGGSGLGLAICHRLALAMGGHISVQSSPGEGTCFTVQVSLPAGQAPAPSVAPAPTDLPRLAGHVLVAEDNAINQLVVVRILRRWGLEVTVAGDGLEALDAVRQQRFSLILMDQFMPGLDGQTTARRLRSSGGWLAQIPIIACTASVSAEERTACLEAGMDDVIAKPLDEQRLFAVLSRYLAAPDLPEFLAAAD